MLHFIVVLISELQSVLLELFALLAQHSITSQELAKYLNFFKGENPPLVIIFYCRTNIFLLSNNFFFLAYDFNMVFKLLLFFWIQGISTAAINNFGHQCKTPAKLYSLLPYSIQCRWNPIIVRSWYVKRPKEINTWISREKNKWFAKLSCKYWYQCK